MVFPPFFPPLTINIRADDWLLLLPFMQTPQACKSATDSRKHLPVSCPCSHSFLMELRGHRGYTNILWHVNLNSKTQRVDIRLIASANFSPLGAWHKAAIPWTFCLLRGWQKGNLDRWQKWRRKTEMFAESLPASRNSNPYFKYCCSFKMTFQGTLPF